MKRMWMVEFPAGCFPVEACSLGQARLKALAELRQCEQKFAIDRIRPMKEINEYYVTHSSGRPLFKTKAFDSYGAAHVAAGTLCIPQSEIVIEVLHYWKEMA